MKIINRVLNIMIFLIITIVLVLGIINFIEPMMYNSDTMGSDIKNYDNYLTIDNVLKKYISYYQNSDIDSIKKCTPFNNIKSDETYNKVISNIKVDSIIISDIKYSFYNVYIVEYSLNTNNYDKILDEPKTNKLIIKLNKLNNSFRVYFDSLVNSI